MENQGACDEVDNAAEYKIMENLSILASQASSDDRDSKNTAINPWPSTRQIDLTLQVPPRPAGFSSSRSGGFLRAFSFKKKTSTLDGERCSLLSSDPKAPPQSSSFSNLSSWHRCTSLPVTPASHFSHQITGPRSARTLSDKQRPNASTPQRAISRSLSFPGKSFLIVRTSSFTSHGNHAPNTDVDQISPAIVHEGQEIPEEKVDCRICFDTCEERYTLKLECLCKGDLRLVHKQCAIKWFRVKGNRICDVCGHEVTNLPIILLRMATASQRDNGEGNIQNSISAWQDIVVLVLISMICYFFLLEELLTQKMKTKALIIAAPFSFTLGVVASILAVILANKEHVWTYSALEFALMAFTLLILYSMLHFSVIYSILIASLLGLGSAMLINSLYVQLFCCCFRAPQAPNTNPV